VHWEWNMRRAVFVDNVPALRGVGADCGQHAGDVDTRGRGTGWGQEREKLFPVSRD
jgi:hypothetical protein